MPKMMDTERTDQPLSTEQAADAAGADLVIVSARLREAQKILRRDWEQLSPRQRSQQSRRVRELELEQESLLEQIEMNRPL